jgi:hypothetical protein
MKNQNSQEILNEILLRMKYDSSMTLSENKKILSEQPPIQSTSKFDLDDYYYDNAGNRKKKENMLQALPYGAKSARTLYPNAKSLNDLPTYRLPNFPTTQKSVPKQQTYKDFTPRPQIPQSDVLGPTGSFVKQLGVDKPSLEMKAKLQKVSPSEYTKKLSPSRYEEFVKERERINKLAPSVKFTEYNKKLSESFQAFQNYDSKLDTWQTANDTYVRESEYYTALYYPEKWTEEYAKGADAHDVLFLVAVGVFAIPLLLAAAGASAAVVGTAFVGAQVVSSAADVADAALYLEEGNLEMAGLSAIFAVLPFVPNLARFTKTAVESAVKKYGKKEVLSKTEQQIIDELSKKETQQQITKAAEQQAAKNMTTEMATAVSKGEKVVKKIVTGAKAAGKTTVGQIGFTLSGFYIVGQTYEKAVESYKKLQQSPINIYQKLVQERKILVSWDDLKWMFGSTGSAEDNTKLGAAMLSGYVGGVGTNIWLYNNPKFQTETWKQKWAPIAKKEIEDKEYEKSVSNYQNLKPEEKEAVIKKTRENMLKDDDGTVRSVEDLDKTAQQLNNMDDLWDVSKPFNRK